FTRGRGGGARSSSSAGAMALADSPCLDGEQDATTTFCMLIPKMPQWKFSNSLLSRSPSNSTSGPVASLAAVLNSCDPVCVTPCSLQAIRGQRAVAAANSASPGGHGFGVTEVMKGSFIHKPSQGWLHPDKKIAGQGASYIVRVSQEKTNGIKAASGAPNKALQSVMGKSNLRFAGMSIAVNISIDGLNLLIPTTRQVIAHHPLQSISFASGGDTDTPDYVAYVSKDPVNQRACHILECSDGLAQSVISTLGQAFELQFRQYLHSPPKTMASVERTEEPIWVEDEDFSEPDYYNRIPGKEPPVGGVVDSRLRPSGALLGHMHTQPQSKTPEVRNIFCTPFVLGLTADGYLCADGQPPGSRDYEEHQYVNTQSLENLDSLTQGPDGHRVTRAPDSPKKDLFDMRPFEDALKLHEACGGGVGSMTSGVLEDQWPSPPRRRAPVAPNEEQLRREPWYHSRMSRRDAEKLLSRDGDFLVRESTTNPGQYVLSGLHRGLPKHLLLVDPEGVVRTKDMLFESITHLVAFHLKNELPIVAAESELHLKRGVRRKQ
uniref:SHC (Src homology 2 domain containing) transforming protein 2 n=1 Tax=Amphilophus citrinellus TaxID=61819 RepID=A0A3Q0S583_AMPCI